MRLRLGLLSVVGRSIAQIVKVQTLHLGVVINFLGQCLADGQADALAVEVDSRQLNADFVANLQHVRNLIHALIADLADMNETVNAGGLPVTFGFDTAVSD